MGAVEIPNYKSKDRLTHSEAIERKSLLVCNFIYITVAIMLPDDAMMKIW